MAAKRNFIYSIDGPTPPEKGELGHWGFDIILDGNFARKMREKYPNEEVKARLNGEGRIIIARYGLEKMGNITPYDFLSGSWLPNSFRVPGNACDLGLECSDREELTNTRLGEIEKGLRPVTYTPHNVDGRDQAFCLLSLFTHWANLTNMVFN